MECRIIMETRKLYEGLGENYDEVLSRFGTDLMVGRFALRFLEDPSFDSLTKGLDDNDAEKAFRGAHTLKGLCATLGFDQLSEKASALTESLRPPRDRRRGGFAVRRDEKRVRAGDRRAQRFQGATIVRERKTSVYPAADNVVRVESRVLLDGKGGGMVQYCPATYKPVIWSGVPTDCPTVNYVDLRANSMCPYLSGLFLCL